jgi:hypothetical protein
MSYGRYRSAIVQSKSEQATEKNSNKAELGEDFGAQFTGSMNAAAITT